MDLGTIIEDSGLTSTVTYQSSGSTIPTWITPSSNAHSLTFNPNNYVQVGSVPITV
jgi:hypothetical protein